MDATKPSNFSIERILGAEVGPSYTTGAESSQHVGCLSGTFHHGHSNPQIENRKYCMPRDLTTAHMLQVPTISHTFDSSSSYLSYGSFNCHHADINLCPTATQNRVFNDERGPQPLCTYLDQGGNQVNRGRMRTVFTDSQTKQLDQLFEQTNYPGVEGRAELARNMGLTEESVRVWFKNRRARRKRQKSSTKAESPDLATSKIDWPTVYNKRSF
ncbi:dharma [Salmo salar]|uniref:Dharma n=1 Tax=Salmo salar TaxID=8030 RepID=A0A1S3SZ12_SALSA|nr:dharma [Salmo salar]|eukprot:XP_014069578.1 PREDICTED: homeobox protein ANF-1-like [Salmo salar]